jgi:hypothetical protein
MRDWPKMPKRRDEKTVLEALRSHLYFIIGRDLTSDAVALMRADGTLANFRQNPSEATWAALYTSALRHTRRTPGRKRGKSTGIPTSLLSPQDHEQALVRSRCYARLASRRVEVINLRREVFGGRLLSPEEADNWLAQDAIRYFSKSWFDTQGVPLLDHISDLIDPRTGQRTRWTDDAVDHCIFQIRWTGGATEIPLREVYDSEPRMREKVRIGHGFRYAQVNSVISQIKSVGNRLAEHYGWQEGDAFVFLVTGQPPATPAVWFKPVARYTDDHSHIHIELHIEPWVSLGSAREIYEHLQKRMRLKQSYSRGERSFPVFEFIEELRDRWIDESGQAASMLDFDWKRATNEWNTTHPEDQLTMSKIKVSYDSAMRTIVHPPYTGPRPLEPMEREDQA